MAENTTLAGAVRGTTANGVPFVALPPKSGQPPVAAVVLWHGGDPPRTEEALAGALPLDDYPAWRVYLGLPLTGRRLPPGGIDELQERGARDPISLVFHPIVSGAMDEFPAAVDDLYQRLDIHPGLPMGLFGFSMGGAVALLAAMRRPDVAPVRAVFTFGAALDFRTLVTHLASAYGMTYEWTGERIRLAREISVLDRPEELARSRAAFRLAVGALDRYPVHDATGRLAAAIREHGGDAEADTIPGLAHAFAAEPGVAAEPPGPDARLLGERVSAWFKTRLQPPGAPAP